MARSEAFHFPDLDTSGGIRDQARLTSVARFVRDCLMFIVVLTLLRVRPGGSKYTPGIQVYTCVFRAP
jgi:hypothetical protein